MTDLDRLVEAIQNTLVVHDGDIVIIRGELSENEVAGLQLAVEQADLNGSVFITLPDDRPVERLEPAAMNAAGWFRVDDDIDVSDAVDYLNRHLASPVIGADEIIRNVLKIALTGEPDAG